MLYAYAYEDCSDRGTMNSFEVLGRGNPVRLSPKWMKIIVCIRIVAMEIVNVEEICFCFFVSLMNEV